MTRRRLRDEYWAAARSCIRRAFVLQGSARAAELKAAVDHTIAALRCPADAYVETDETPTGWGLDTRTVHA